MNRARVANAESGAKRFVPVDDVIESGIKSGAVKEPRYAEGGRDDVSRAVWFELV